MGKNKFVYFGQTLIDLTEDDVTVADVAQGKKFHLPSGESAVGTASGGGGGMQIGTATQTLASASTSIQFTVSGEPTSFAVMSSADISTGGTKALAVVYDGTDTIGQTLTSQVTYDGSNFGHSYSNGTLTVTGMAPFQPNEYSLVYTYGGNNIDTADVQVGSGATSITFTGLEEEPSYWSLLFKSDFSASSGYQRVIAVAYDGEDIYGLAMGSGAKAQTSWSYTYNNGTLTITSQGTNNGGYFHQPGYYQLTYGTATGGGNYQSKTVTPSASDQVITADVGYDALKKVTVEGDADLIASNIKSGVSIFNVLGTYSAGGGASIGTKTLTNNDNTATSLQFTNITARPKAFVLRLTTTITSSGSTSYYYVVCITNDGTNTKGTYFRIGSTRGVYNDTTHYSFTYSGTTLTISTSGSRTGAGGSFYNGTYELIYIY